jgi:hypothetical protein
MEDLRFDQATRRLASRRSVLGLLGGLAALGVTSATAKRPPASCLAPDFGSSDGSQGLQTAIDAAKANSRLHLCAGTWTLTTTVTIGKTLTLAGAGSADTVLQQTRFDTRVLGITGRAKVVLRGLTVTGGRSAWGAGIYNEATLTLGAGSLVFGNTAGVGGGGIYNYAGTLTVATGSTVRDNAAREGGGIYTNDGATTTVATGAIICNNSTPQCSGLGSLTGTCPSSEYCPI